MRRVIEALDYMIDAVYKDTKKEAYIIYVSWEDRLELIKEFIEYCSSSPVFMPIITVNLSLKMSFRNIPIDFSKNLPSGYVQAVVQINDFKSYNRIDRLFLPDPKLEEYDRLYLLED